MTAESNEEIKTTRIEFAKKTAAVLGGILAFSGFGKLFARIRRDNKQGDHVLVSNEPYIGEIALYPYGFVPVNWAECNGALLAISSNTTLFSLIGTTYGGNGVTTFALPDLRGRLVLHQGTGPGLTTKGLGESAGAENTPLITSQIPVHTHNQNVLATGTGTLNNPSGKIRAFDSDGIKEYSNTQNVTMSPTGLANAGNSTAHNNTQPYLAMTYCIALFGIFPSHA